MITNVGMSSEVMGRPIQYKREVLVEQNHWLIRLRWIAVGGIVAVALVNSYVLPYSVLVDKDGVIRWQYTGEIQPDDVSKLLSELL